MKIDVFGLSRSDWEMLIDEWIFNEETRRMLKRRLLDGVCYEKIAEEFGFSTVAIYKRIGKAKEILFKNIDKIGKV